MVWTIETLSEIVDRELADLPVDLRARLVRTSELIETYGFQNLPRDSVRHLEGKLWEIRLSAGGGIARAIYVTAAGQRVVIVRVFVKKTQKTPLREIALARQRAKDIA